MTAMFVRGVAIALSGWLVSSGVARAADGSDLELCFPSTGKVEVDPGDVTRIPFGRQRVLVGNTTGDQGFICLLNSSPAGRSLAALAFEGQVGSVSEPRRIDLSTGPHLLTVQKFSAGSSAIGTDYVMYRFDPGRIRKVLRIRHERERTIADYGLYEKNVLSPAKIGLRVSQTQSFYSIRDGRRSRVFYEAKRSFRLRYEAEIGAFIEGVAVCTDDLRVKGKVWLKKGERVGYFVDPGITEAGGGVTVSLVRGDGETTELIDLIDLASLQLDPPDPSPGAIPRPRSPVPNPDEAKRGRATEEARQRAPRTDPASR